MRGESYYLFLTDKNGTSYRVSKLPVTLQTMDEHTTKYKNKKELINTIIKNTKLKVKPEDIVDVSIYMKPNKNKEEYKKEAGPFYSSDFGITNKDSIAARFELYSFNKEFVLYFLKNYINIKNFRPSIATIESLIENNESYHEDLLTFAEKLFKTYKGARYVYSSMKLYESKKKSNNKYNKEDENKMDELRYLIEHDRELLDIEDFNHFEFMSPFDGNKKL